MKFQIIFIALIINGGVVIDQDQSYYEGFSENLVQTKDIKEIYKYAFMAREFIELTKKDTSFIDH